MGFRLPKLPARPRDERRQELSALIVNSKNVPRAMRAMAHLAVHRMSEEELTRALTVAREAVPLVEAGDLEGIRKLLRVANIPEELLDVAEKMLLAGPQSGEPDP